MELLEEFVSHTDLMKTFLTADVTHWKDYDADSDRKPQMAVDGKLPECNSEFSAMEELQVVLGCSF